MKITYGPYNIRTHELDNKLSVQVTSDLGEIHIIEEGKDAHDFPNGISFKIENPETQPEAKGLRRYSFGDYTFILGINYNGELCLYHSVRLYVGKKVINNINTLTLSFLTEPKA
jgi:hypothetical protein